MHRGRLWIVEEHDDLRDMWRTLFLSQGFDVEAFANTDDFLRAGGEAVALVVDAWTVRAVEARVVAKIPPTKTVALVSTRAEQESWCGLGACSVLLMPAWPEDVLAAVMGALPPSGCRGALDA